MARKQTQPAGPPARKRDRHLPARQVRIREEFAAILEQLGERNLSGITEEANRLIRQGLEREGLWPAKGGGA